MAHGFLSVSVTGASSVGSNSLHTQGVHGLDLAVRSHVVTQVGLAGLIEIAEFKVFVWVGNGYPV